MTTLVHAVWTPETWRSASWRYIEHPLLSHCVPSVTPACCKVHQVIHRRSPIKGRSSEQLLCSASELPTRGSCCHLLKPLAVCLQIRTQIASEMIDDLKDIAEENALLMRESIAGMFSLEQVVEHPLESAPDQETV